MDIIIAILFFAQIFSPTLGTTVDDYNYKRRKLLEKESKLYIGGNIQLNSEEIIANRILMQLKDNELNNANRIDFSQHYFQYKNDINKSEVYKIIKRMPKGAALHVHGSLMLSAERLLDYTYEDHLYICLGDDVKFKFSLFTPLQRCSRKWRLLEELRNSTKNIHKFDMELKKHFTIYSKDPSDLNSDVNFIWTEFSKALNVIFTLIDYRPVREKIFYDALKEFYNDNIVYVEIRTGMGALYELNGTVHEPIYLAHLYHQVTAKFKKDCPDFVGVKFIFTSGRNMATNKIKEVVDTARRVKRELPDFFAGFDLVGQEDLGKPLLAFQSVLNEFQNDTNFYFHAGETKWFGTSSDENLVDAILLGSKRIGHGYALIKHPSLLATVKEKDIAIEVNVISNLVLSLLCDARNHPLAVYLALGMPVVLSSDDPGAWGADPLSHDFYIAFVGVASRRADLRMLKQLVINSVKYSALDEKGKLFMTSQLNEKWNKFIKYLITAYS